MTNFKKPSVPSQCLRTISRRQTPAVNDDPSRGNKSGVISGPSHCGGLAERLILRR